MPNGVFFCKIKLAMTEQEWSLYVTKQQKRDQTSLAQCCCWWFNEIINYKLKPHIRKKIEMMKWKLRGCNGWCRKKYIFLDFFINFFIFILKIISGSTSLFTETQKCKAQLMFVFMNSWLSNFIRNMSWGRQTVLILRYFCIFCFSYKALSKIISQ